MKKVLFVCTGNTCRSPMAEYLFNAMCEDNALDYIARSAGLCTVTGLSMSANSLDALRDNGIDGSEFTSTSIEDVDIGSVDVFAVMTPEHRDMLRYFGADPDKIYILSEHNGGITDPYGGSSERYRQCCDEIKAALGDLIVLMDDKL